ncbi:MAG: response regulator [Epsilonproteobacteria bacterium]|nr:response regulator [Campylobacterota bacterium]
MSIDAYEKIKFDDNLSIHREHESKKYKILLISQNSLDIFLVNKLLHELGDFKVYEAGNLKAALKVVSYLSLDLIIVDDTLPTISGYEVINRLNRNHILKDVPKVMLLTEDYKERQYESLSDDNLDFVKKPIDNMIFKTRIHSILKNQHSKFLSGSVFENMIDTKISEAKEFLKIYQSFLDIDENLLFVYDKQKNQIVESNKNFIKFFGQHSLFNRVINNRRLLKRFIPVIKDPNYLNNHHSSTWIDLVTGAQDFNFLITINNRAKKYSFNVTVEKINLFNKEIYIIKLSNHYIHIPASRFSKHQLEKINVDLHTLQNAIDKLETTPHKQEIASGIQRLLETFEVPLESLEMNIQEQQDSINIYFLIAQLLKKRASSLKITLNDQAIDHNFNSDASLFYTKVSADALNDTVKGILESYLDDGQIRLDVKLYRLESNIKIEMIATAFNSAKEDSKLVTKLFNKKENEEKQDMMQQMIPKKVQNALVSMNADIKTYFDNGQNIFLISIPTS